MKMEYGVKILTGRRRVIPWEYKNEENFNKYLKWKDEEALFKAGVRPFPYGLWIGYGIIIFVILIVIGLTISRL